MKNIIKVTIAIIFLFTAINFGQDAKEKTKPKTLVFSQNKVQMADMGKVNKMIDEVFAPILNQLVDEGMLYGWGQLNHAWGDEWNLNIWYSAENMGSFYKFWGEYIKRVREKHPKAFGEATKLFQAHKDNIYSIVQSYSGKE